MAIRNSILNQFSFSKKSVIAKKNLNVIILLVKIFKKFFQGGVIMKRTRLISIILVILMLLNALSPCLNVVFAETVNSTQVNAGNITLGGNDGTSEAANNSGVATYVNYGEFNNKLYKAIKADLIP